MKTIAIYDPPMCCSTGVCGPEVDPELVSFAALLAQLRERGVVFERHNLAQEPLAFVQNPTVRTRLENEGVEVLPLIFWDGEIQLQGRYPTKAEHAEWIRAALGDKGSGQ